MVTCRTIVYFLIGTLQLIVKSTFQKLKLFRMRARLLAHSGSSEAARIAARRKAHTSKTNPARIPEMSVIWNFFGDIASNFRCDYIGRWTIVFRFRKTFENRRNVFVVDKQWDVNIQREARFAIVHRSNRASNKIADTSLVQRERKKVDAIRFGRGQIHGQQFFGIPLRKDSDWLAVRQRGGHSVP